MDELRIAAGTDYLGMVETAMELNREFPPSKELITALANYVGITVDQAHRKMLYPAGGRYPAMPHAWLSGIQYFDPPLVPKEKTCPKCEYQEDCLYITTRMDGLSLCEGPSEQDYLDPGAAQRVLIKIASQLATKPPPVTGIAMAAAAALAAKMQTAKAML